MKNTGKKLFFFSVLLGLSLMLLASCGSQDASLELSDLETVEYQHPHHGGTITVPADWQLISEDEDSAVFANEAGTVSFSFRWELGGMSYFSEEELASLAASVGSATLENAEVYESLELTKFDAAVKAVMTGTAENETGEAVNAVCDTAVIQYFHDVRYYLTAITDVGTYERYRRVFTQIANSFTCALSEDEVYQMINEQQEAEQEQTAEQGE